MNQREKTLLMVVAVIPTLAVAFWGLNKVTEKFNKRRADITRISGAIDVENVKVLGGLRAAEDLAYWEERSLSDDREEAQSLYKAWVADWAKRNGFKEPKFKVDSARDRILEQKLQYRTHSLTISGKTDLGKLTQMLYEFETAKQLHRMRALNIQPLGDKVLDVLISIDAMALPDTMARSSIETDEELVARLGPVDQIKAPIFQRNLFGPENNAPQLGVRSSYTVNLGSSLEIDLAAKDRDDIDKLTYEAKLDELSGARLRGSKVEWRPRELGEYYAEFEVKDDGFPSMTHKREVKISVVKPPPPRPRSPPPPAPKFDYSKYTQLTAIIVKGGEPTAWLWIRPTDERLKVKVGDSFQIGELEGTMTAMEYNSATFSSDGKLYQMGMRDFVGKAKVIGDAEQPVAAKATTDEQPSDAEHLPPLETLPAETADKEAAAAEAPQPTAG